MHKLAVAIKGRPFRLYLLGLAIIFAGAWAMAALNSMLPMALASSAGLMLGVPLLRQLFRRSATPSAPPRR